MSDDLLTLERARLRLVARKQWLACTNPLPQQSIAWAECEIEALATAIAALEENAKLRGALRNITRLEAGSRGAYGKFAEAQSLANTALEKQGAKP